MAAAAELAGSRTRHWYAGESKQYYCGERIFGAAALADTGIPAYGEVYPSETGVTARKADRPEWHQNTPIPGQWTIVVRYIGPVAYA